MKTKCIIAEKSVNGYFSKKNKEEVVVVERSDPSMLALFDKYQAQIDEQNERIVKQVLDERNRRLQKIAEKSSTKVK